MIISLTLEESEYFGNICFQIIDQQLLGAGRGKYPIWEEHEKFIRKKLVETTGSAYRNENIIYWHFHPEYIEKMYLVDHRRFIEIIAPNASKEIMIYLKLKWGEIDIGLDQ